MKMIAKMADFADLKSCCSRKPIIGTVVDLAECRDILFDRCTIYCPVCNRMVADLAFPNAKFKWNQSILHEDCKDFLDHTIDLEVFE